MKYLEPLKRAIRLQRLVLGFRSELPSWCSITTGMATTDICWGDRLGLELLAARLPTAPDAELELEQSSSRNVAFSRMVVYTSALAINVVDLTPNKFSSLPGRWKRDWY